MKKIWIIANWKSNKNITEALTWISEVGPHLRPREDIQIVVCPGFTELEEVHKSVLTGNFPIMVGSQDLSPFPPGAYTGEESAQELVGLVQLAILGHSERRLNFAETDEMIAQKVKQADKAGITPLVCVQSTQTPVPDGCRLVAFEPIEAIGSGQPDTPKDAEEVATSLKERYGPDLTVLYGGSVESRNVGSFIKQPDISGVLIGGASLDAREFVKIVKIVYED
ncbi:hypothetical protein A2631_04680 [Candidatus Daviesbacteria bacterium RIFCSPHIGHO2_01_FULL_44_29]|uniref:Triosephosphate isomerase n=1 Tax=Candidatus Daviesbacteria bacterium RIFCSPHIGHO2_02_FULL_43_12 TaxID=1797776 RepID=A0A1F5KGF8_9BACT|nr:MAG: hypothetical protein A2631_04680 [Candidatus Daviesbacteria bacterium RIFCSPHIGHO2_01_FULL_44_29]OGE40016.1 MAG: hypothetical protein A3D25_04410 [Candidatus Daviesbacteria bacterium RIFCSPHIGHO2_02_FULL_43_12]OGE41501.1 MAG: hypothetical protein A3E86_05400 [Candidatus Daviesbacteria bacterium RIFCSPHIGHO2_12_FULL_47_45]OGE70303.1 MAG: hypothetical protein A3B55_01160 [Candidatus Daviesbacteria bacterium RIFCSPLOWO2_01_FULL_43_15]